MSMSDRQRDRLIRLFNAFMDFTLNDIMAHYSGPDDLVGLREELANVLSSKTWGPHGDPIIIDRFVRENPLHLTKRDLDDIASWKDGVYLQFPIALIDETTYFLAAECAIAVQSAVPKPFAHITLPALVQTLIIPFEGMICLVPPIALQAQPISAKAAKTIESTIRFHIDHGDVIRTATELAGLVQTMREETIAGFTLAAMQDEVDECDLQEHRGVLAGLTWQERVAAVQAYENAEALEAHERILATIDGGVVSQGLPPTSLRETYRRVDRELLVRIATFFGIQGNPEQMPPDQLIECLLEIIPLTARDLVDAAIRRGPREVAFLKDIVNHDGTLSIPDKGVRWVLDLPTTVEPHSHLFHIGDTYVATIPPEFAAALKDTNWDEAMELARLVERSYNDLCTLVELHGVIPMVAYTENLRRLIGKRSPDLFLNALDEQLRLDSSRVCYVLLPDENDYYFVHPRFTEDEDFPVGATLTDPQLLSDIQDLEDHRQDYPPRLVTHLDDAPSAIAWVRNHDSYQELVAFLDEHVPDFANDYSFATDFADDLVCTMCAALDDEEIDDTARSYAIDVAGEDTPRLCELIDHLIDDVPLWINCGWTKKEIRRALELRAQEEAKAQQETEGEAERT